MEAMSQSPSSPKQGYNNNDDEAGLAISRRVRSLDLENQPRDNNGAIRKTKSLNNQIINNVDELVRNVSRRFNNISFQSGNPMTFAFAFHGVSRPSNHLSGRILFQVRFICHNVHIFHSCILYLRSQTLLMSYT